MIVKALRNLAMPALLSLVVAISIALPCAAHADEFESSNEFGTHSISAEHIGSSLLNSCDVIAAGTKADMLTDLARTFEGTPYVYGGTRPGGFDCSGFTQYCFREALGIDLPRTADAQATLGTSVPMDQLQAGDLLFWGSGSGVYHVGIYLEEGTYIHAAGSGKGVKVQTMEYYTPSFAKRII